MKKSLLLTIILVVVLILIPRPQPAGAVIDMSSAEYSVNVSVNGSQVGFPDRSLLSIGLRAVPMSRCGLFPRPSNNRPLSGGGKNIYL